MKIEDVFRKLRPIMGPQLDTLWQEYVIADTATRQTLERTLRVMLAQRLRESFDSEHVLLKPPPADVARGEYRVGRIYYGNDAFSPFGLREDELIQHIGIFGRSGSGKTNLAYLLLHGLTKAGKPYLVFDWKRNYRDLLGFQALSNLSVFTVGRDIAPFHFNPLIPPPATPATVWLKKLIEIICHAYFLGEGVTVLLMRAIDHLYRETGLYGGRPTRYPTMADVRDHLLAYKAKGREAGWMESAMRAVEVLCFGDMGVVLNSGAANDVAALLNKRVILELDALTNADKVFLIESLLLWIHHYRLAQDQREELKHVIVIEEAHHILLRKKQEVTGEEAVTDILLREIRELGEAIIVLDQHPSLISKPALGNTYTTFCFNLKHRGDIAMIQDSLHLDSEQVGYLGRLEVGSCVLRLQGRWFFPFLIRLPLFRVNKGAVTDEMIRKRASSAVGATRPAAPREEGYSAAIPADRGDSGPARTEDKGIPAVAGNGKQEETCTIRLTTQERRFLKDVSEHPASTVTERYRRLSLSSRHGNSLQSSLLGRSLLSSCSVALPTGRTKMLELSPRGKQALGISSGETNRHGGPTHRFWVQRIAEHLRHADYKVRTEYRIGGGKAIDIVAERAGKRIAYEIETGKSDAVANVHKCLQYGVDRVAVVAVSQEAKTEIAAALPSHPHVVCLTVSEALSTS